jgi:hypothetical protein
MLFTWKSIAVLIAKYHFSILVLIFEKKTLKQHKNVCFNNLLFIFYYSKGSVLASFTPNYRLQLHVAGFKNSLHYILVLLWFAGPFISLNLFYFYMMKIKYQYDIHTDSFKMKFSQTILYALMAFHRLIFFRQKWCQKVKWHIMEVWMTSAPVIFYFFGQKNVL